MEPESLWEHLWRPPAETLEAIAGVLRAHWRAARMRAPHLFWSTPASWLRPGRHEDGTAHHLTSGGKLIK